MSFFLIIYLKDQLMTGSNQNGESNVFANLSSNPTIGKQY
jgi:hypothetical protein